MGIRVRRQGRRAILGSLMAGQIRIAFTADFLDAAGRPAFWEEEFAPLAAAADRAFYHYFDEHIPEIAPDQAAGVDTMP